MLTNEQIIRSEVHISSCVDAHSKDLACLLQLLQLQLQHFAPGEHGFTGVSMTPFAAQGVASAGCYVNSGAAAGGQRPN